MSNSVKTNGFEEVKFNLEDKIEKSLENLRQELNTVRAGRANPALVDRIDVDYYGTATPLKQLANISCPDPRTIQITPFDPQALKTVEHAILAANVGINPSNDGKNIRLAIPQVTEERRKELTKIVKSMGEETKVSIRNLRRHANDEVKKLEKSESLREDEVKRDLDDIQKIVDNTVKDIEKIVANKDKEIMEV